MSAPTALANTPGMPKQPRPSTTHPTARPDTVSVIPSIVYRADRTETIEMTKDELTTWALANGWRMISGHPSLSKPSRPADAIVRLVLKATVVNVEIRKPAGKWEKISGAAYAEVAADPDTGVPRGLGLVSTPGFAKLMQENRDSMMFGRLTARGVPPDR